MRVVFDTNIFVSAVASGVDGEEIGATRHMGAALIRHDGIVLPMNGAGTRLTLATYNSSGGRM